MNKNGWTQIKEGKYKRELEKTVDGKRYRISKTVTTDLTGLKLKAFLNTTELEMIEQLEIKTLDVNYLKDLNFKEYSQLYLKNKSFEQKTIDWYEEYLKNRTYDWLGNKTVSKITDLEIKDFFDYLKNLKSDSTGKKLSAKTLKHYKTILHAIFENMKNKKIISENPVSDIKITLPKRSVKDKFYNPDEVKNCIELLNKYAPLKYTLCFILTISTGIRPAELRGLKWNKLDFELKTITIDESLAQTKKGSIIKGTKTDDIRILDMTDSIIPYLLAHRENEKQKYLTLKQKKSFDDCYVFSGSVNEYMYAEEFNKFWKNFCLKYGIRYIPPYGLRHTTATLLAYNNVSIKSIGEQLGQKNISTTEIYIHAVDAEKEKIKNILNKSTIIPFKKIS